jgi:hypothetical protein
LNSGDHQSTCVVEDIRDCPSFSAIFVLCPKKKCCSSFFLLNTLWLGCVPHFVSVRRESYCCSKTEYLHICILFGWVFMLQMGIEVDW